jgi:hypothetical protein
MKPLFPYLPVGATLVVAPERHTVAPERHQLEGRRATTRVAPTGEMIRRLRCVSPPVTYHAALYGAAENVVSYGMMAEAISLQGPFSPRLFSHRRAK